MKKISLIVLFSLTILFLFSCSNNMNSEELTGNNVGNNDDSSKTDSITEEYILLTEVSKSVLDNTQSIFRTIGRTYERDDGIACDFSCTGIEFNAYCEGDIYINISSTKQSYLTVYIDNVRQNKRISVTKSDSWIKVASDIKRGQHTITIVKQSQFNMATHVLHEVKITGEFKEKSSDKDLFFEFYGDSILNGSNVYLGGTSVKTSDATRAFGWIAAQQLNADCNIIGQGGLSLVAENGKYNMLGIYDLAGSPSLKDVPKYDFSRIPDAVIIELGINDYVNGGLSKTPSIYADGVRLFIDNIREKYGNDVPIVWLYGYRDDNKDFWNTTKKTLNEIISNGDNNIHFCKVSKAYVKAEAGGDGWHPNVDMSEKFGKEVADFLKELLKI